MKVLIVQDHAAEYVIECPPDSEVKKDRTGTLYVVVPDPDEPDEPLWLFNDILLRAARQGAFGVRMLAETQLN